MSLRTIFTFLVLFVCVSTFFDIKVEGAVERIELDYKFTTNTVTEFYLLSHFLDGKETIRLGDQIYGVEKSTNEFFVDYYLDTPDLSLLKDDTSLRMRSRFINGQLSKRLIQFKTPIKDNADARFEHKLKIPKSTEFQSITDVVNFLQLPTHTKNRVVSELSDSINLASLREVVEINQIRTRYYLTNAKGKPFYTITFDESYARKGMDIIPFFEIEFEINEKRMGQAKEDEASVLLTQIQELIQKAKSTQISMHSNNISKYKRAINSLGIDTTQTKGITFSFVLVIIAGILIGFYLLKERKS